MNPHNVSPLFPSPQPGRLLRPRAEPGHRIRVLGMEGLALEAGAQPALVLVLEGEVSLFAHDYSLRLQPGSVLACDGREPVTLRPEPLARAELLCFWPDPTTLIAPWEGGPERSLLLPMVHEPDSDIAVLMQRLADTLARTGTRSLDGTRPAQFWLNAMLSAQEGYTGAISRCHGRTHSRRRDLFVRLARARALLAAGEGVAPAEDQGADIGRLAQVARLSTSHFVRLFHQVFGEPPHRFRIRRRMQRAFALIRETDMPIHEVMWRVGFDNHSCFARAFRQHFGRSATAVRGERCAAAA